MVKMHPAFNSTKIILERKFKPSVRDVLAKIKDGLPIPIYVGSMLLGDAVVSSNVYYIATDEREIEITVKSAGMRDALANYGVGVTSTLSLSIVDNRFRLTVVDKKSYVASALELEVGSMKAFGAFTMSPNWDNKQSLSKLLEKTTAAFTFTSRGEPQVALQLKGDKDLTVLKHSASGWLYDADMGTNIETMSGLKLMDKTAALKSVASASSYLEFNP